MFTSATLTDFRAALQTQPRALVVALCAQWCGTCREFRQTFSQLEQRFPQAVFFWIDVEDDAALAEEIDVQDFPSLAIYDAQGVAHYFGTSLPQEGVVTRLLTTTLTTSLTASTSLHTRPAHIPPEAALLYAALTAS